MPADADPQPVITAVSDWPPVGVAQQPPVRRGVPFPGVADEPGHEREGDRLPADRLALLPEQDQALLSVQVQGAQRERAAAPAGGLGVQPQDHRVKFGVIARGGGDLVDLRQPGAGHGPAGGRQAAGLGHLPCGVVPLVDQPVVLGVPVQAAQRSDEVLGCTAPAAGVAARYHVCSHVGHELLDLRRRRLVHAPGAPLLDHPVPVGAVRPAGSAGDRGGHDRDVVGEGQRRRPLPGGGGQVVRGQAHPLQDQQRRVHGGLLG